MWISTNWLQVETWMSTNRKREIGEENLVAQNVKFVSNFVIKLCNAKRVANFNFFVTNLVFLVVDTEELGQELLTH